MEKEIIIMTREEFEIYKAELMERFYWCTTISEMRYLTREKGHKFLFCCTHFKTDKYFWVFARTDDLLKDADEFHKKRHEEKSKAKESEAVAVE